MPGATVRINPADRELLRQLAEREGDSMQSVLARALEAYRRHRFLEESNRAFARLKADSEAWREEADERALWDTNLSDGVDPE